MVFTDIALIALFILIGGVFAAAEMGLVSLRDSQVRKLSTRGKRGRTVAKLASDPNNFLSAVQIGVTLFGFLSASFGGVTLSGRLSEFFQKYGVSQSLADLISLPVITIVISYFSIVFGELAAKRLAMQRAEAVSMALAPMINGIAKIAKPVIWFLGISTDLVVRICGGNPETTKEEVSNEELRAMVTGAESLGVEEREIVDEIFDAGQVTLREAMVPRTEVEFLSGEMLAYKAIREMQKYAYSRFPVTGEDADDILGFIHVRDLIDMDSDTRMTPIAQLVRPILSLPQSMLILRALKTMQQQNATLALVKDEYGGTAGIVTLEDLVEELIGEINDEYDKAVAEEVVSEYGDFTVDGLLTLEEFSENYHYELPEGPYDTVAGFIMAQLGRLPKQGDSIELQLKSTVEAEPRMIPLEFQITKLDGRRAAWFRLRHLDNVGKEIDLETES